MKKIFILLSIFCITIFSANVTFALNAKKDSTVVQVKDTVITRKKAKKQNTKKEEQQKTDTTSTKAINNQTIILPKTDSLKLFISAKMLPFYDADFDVLVTKTSLSQLQRDKDILKFAAFNDSTLTVKIAELEEYHNAKILLSKKYNKQQVDITIKELGNKQFSGAEIDKLKLFLEKYGVITKELRETIQEIERFVNSKIEEGAKKIIILSGINEQIFKFLYPDDNGNLDMSNYPFVFDICNRILKIKKENLNEDILYLLEEL